MLIQTISEHRNLSLHSNIYYIWCPYVGNVGTIRASLNIARALARDKEKKIFLIRNGSEWIGYENEVTEDNIYILDIGMGMRLLYKGKSGYLQSRIYFIFASIFGFYYLTRLSKLYPKATIFTCLLAAPVLLLKKIQFVKFKVFVSVQGLPTVLSNQSTSVIKKFENRVRFAFWKKVYPEAEKILFLTEETYDTAKKIFPHLEDKYKVLFNPIITPDIDVKAAAPINNVSNSQNCIKLLAVGRLTYQKNYEFLLRAVSKLKVDGISFELKILGTGELKNDLIEKISECKLRDHVELLGFVKNPYPYYQWADAFVMTSRWEDMPHTLVEAAYLNTFIISLDFPNGPSYITNDGDYGILVKENNERAFADALIDFSRLSQDERSLKTRQAKLIAGEFTLDNFSENIGEVLNDL